jgi:hypothetical protein
MVLLEPATQLPVTADADLHGVAKSPKEEDVTAVPPGGE